MVGQGKWSEDEYLMISGIQHFIFCRRQWALIHIEQVWAENYYTTHGSIVHERADQNKVKEKRGDIITVRGLHVSSKRLGMNGICDVVEFHKNIDGAYMPHFNGSYIPYPVEYKRGKVKEDNSDRYQLLAQLMSLEEMLAVTLEEASIFYNEVKRRTSYKFTEVDKAQLIDIAEEMHSYYKRGYTPKPKKTKKCNSCSLKNICLPKLDKTISASAYLGERQKECESC